MPSQIDVKSIVAYVEVEEFFSFFLSNNFKSTLVKSIEWQSNFV